jgi:L-methionine (R)-S-oxide reductase
MENFLRQASQIIENNSQPLGQRLLEICRLINTTRPEYTWVGFYFMNDEAKTLHLGPFVGAPTDHEVIPYGKGICGQVAAGGKTYRADSVAEEENYIACSLDVKSEIVIPIYDEETLVAQLDIDSSEISAFSAEDEKILEALCYSLGAQLGPEMHFGELELG